MSRFRLAKIACGRNAPALAHACHKAFESPFFVDLHYVTVKVYQAAKVPGFVGTYIYRMDADPHEYYLAVLFASKEAYVANAQSPEQDARYRQMLQLLEEEPEWHDGEVVYEEKPLA